MIVSMLLLSAGLTLDTLGVAVSYGIKGIRVPFFCKLLISVLSSVSCAVSICAGEGIGELIPPGVCRLAGFLILFLTGIYVLVSSIMNSRREACAEPAAKSVGAFLDAISNPSRFDKNKSNVIEKKEALLLGLALSADSTSVGFAVSLSGNASLLMSAAVGIIQLLFMYLGLFIGNRISQKSERDSKLISLLPGVLILTVAVTGLVR